MKISVIGMGMSGISAANMMHSKGHNVFVSEREIKEKKEDEIKLLNPGINYETGSHTEKMFDAEIIIKSPGVSNNLEILQEAKRKNIEIISEIEAAYRYVKANKIIAVTGTNGKTTTTTLIGEIFRNAGLKTFVAGNIGEPLSDLTNLIDSSSFVILEISSYQLEDIKQFKPDISVVLNITPDHLEHHGSMDEYYNSKKRITLNQDKNCYCILNYNDSYCRKMADGIKQGKNPPEIIFFSTNHCSEATVCLHNGKFNVNTGRGKYSFTNNSLLPGRHNLENLLAALASAVCCRVPQKVIEKTFGEFKGVEHRLEFAGEIAGVVYINDSKSTNVDSTRVALESYDVPIILIMGGRHKGFPYTPLKDLIKNKVKTLLLIGEAAKIIKSDLQGVTDIENCVTLENAVERARKVALENYIVLLSPGCSSFDQYKNFEYRGRQFKELVRNLM
ncbi:MAG: UDP-N-acetylmuramoyl-L-alanine--D-glutamate ligase [Elusimicrobiota bacterium]